MPLVLKGYSIKDHHYDHYDNYDAINVDRAVDIPIDYDGVIGVPITILNYLWEDGKIHCVYTNETMPKKKKATPKSDFYIECLEKNPIFLSGNQFEIVSFRKGEDGKDLVFTREREREFNLTFVSLFDTNCRDDKKCRRKSEWENYLRKNNNKAYKEPIDYFFPIEWQMSGNQRARVNNKLMYARLFIRRIS